MFIGNNWSCFVAERLRSTARLIVSEDEIDLMVKEFLMDAAAAIQRRELAPTTGEWQASWILPRAVTEKGLSL